LPYRFFSKKFFNLALSAFFAENAVAVHLMKVLWHFQSLPANLRTVCRQSEYFINRLLYYLKSGKKTLPAENPAAIWRQRQKPVVEVKPY
jgi:hypothetical protein